MALTKVQTIGIETGISLTGVTTVTTLNASTDTLSVGGTVNFGGNVSIAGTLTYEDVTNIDAVGLITARSGISITGGDLTVPDAIIHTDDTNTRIRFPTADTFSVETAGNERLRVDSNGDVGIGTNDPVVRVHIGGATPYIRVKNTGSPSDEQTWDFNAGTDGIFRFRNTNDAANSSNNWLEVERDGVSTDSIRLLTGSGSERLRIDSSGRLLLGTNSAVTAVPTAESDAPGLQVSKTNKPTSIALYRNDTSIANGNTLGGIHWYGNDTTSNTPTVLASMQVQADGTHAAGDNPTRITFSATADGASSVTERMRIDSSGRLMLGTTTPGHSTADLFTIASSGSNGMTIRSGSSDAGQISFSDATTGDAEYRGQILYHHDGDYMRFRTAAVERIRIDGSGRLLVGASSSADQNAKIQASTTGYEVFEGFNYGNDAVGSIIRLAKSRATSIGSQTIVQADDELGRISFLGTDGSNYRNAAVISAEVDLTPGSSDMPGRLVFKTTPDGSSTPTERMRIDSAGRLLLGTSTARANFFNSSSNYPQFQIEGTDSQNSALSLTRNVNSSGYAPLHFAKSRGTSVGSNTIVQSGDYLGGVIFSGSDGSEFVSAAAIHSEVDGTPGANDMPGRLTFHTTSDGASSPTERVRIDKDGAIQLYGNSSSLWSLAAASDSSSYSQIDAHFSTGNRTLFLNSNTSNNAFAVWNRNSGSSGKGFGLEGQIFKVVQGSSEQMRIDASGRMGLGTSSPTTDANTTIYRNASGQFALNLLQDHASGHVLSIGGDGGTVVYFYNNSTRTAVAGTISKTASSVSYNTSSDYRLKENIIDLDGAIARVKQLAPKRFNFITDADMTVDGFLAHEAQTVVPESVTGTHNEVDDDGNPVMQGMDQAKLVPLLTAALQEAIAEIETLKTKVAALEG